MEKKLVYVVRLMNKDNSRTYVGKHQSITDPFSYQLFQFACDCGFDTPESAMNAPVSFLNDGKAVEAKVVPLEIY